MLGTPYELQYVLYCEAMHFGFGFLSGLSAAWLALPLIQTTFGQTLDARPTWAPLLVLVLLSAFVGAGSHCFADFVLDPGMAAHGWGGGF